ncbi:MAG: hypothetical protein KC441_05525 [Anaerolineales bacterium]|nr:hypothetical protein [Anaerolineales bacterium]
MKSLLAKLTSIFKHTGKETAVSSPPCTPSTEPLAGLSEENLKRLMHMLEHTHEGMFSCAETFNLLDEYAELAASNADAAALMPCVQRHLELCPGCRQEYEILLCILQSEFPPVA